MKKKVKSIITVVLVFVLIITSLGGDSIEVNAALSTKGYSFNLNGVSWGFSTDEGKLFGTMNIENIEKNAILEFPSYAKIAAITDTNSWDDLNSCFSDSKTLGYYPSIDMFLATKCEQANVSKIIAYEDWPSFPCGKSWYLYKFQKVPFNTSSEEIDIDPSLGMFYGNTSIKEIEIDTGDKNGMEFCPAVFAGMTGLEKVNINVGVNQTLTLDGSVFEGCTNLTQVTLTGKSVEITGGFNFSGCTKLSKIVINGSTTVSGEEDFKECTSLKEVIFNGETKFTASNSFRNISFPKATFGFNGKVSNNSGVSVISRCDGIETISLNGEKSYLEKNFVTNSKVENFNVEKEATLGAEAICETNITGMSFNAATQIGNGALVKCTVENMYFNTSQVTSIDNTAGAIGNGTTVNRLYLNHYDISRNADKVTELNSVPFGNNNYTLKCKSIYVFSPNFHSIKNTVYPGDSDTVIYGYGGTLSSYGDSTQYMTGKDMFEKWIGNNNSYKNMIELIGEKPNEIKLFVTNSTDKATFDLSTLKIAAQYNDKASVLDQLPVDKNGNVLNETFELQYTNDPGSSTNFNYKILTKVDDSYIQGKQYIYTDKDGVKYITCQEDKLELGVGTYHYYVQAAGETWPLTIEVKQNKISKIKVSIKDKGQKDGKLHVTVGDELAKVKGYITVTAVLADEKTEVELDESQYKLVKTDLSESSVTAQDTELMVHYQGLEEMVKLMDVQVHERKIASFHVACDKANMPIASRLTLNDLTLTEGVYDNPLDTPIAKINNGYHFLQDGQETDVYTIKSGKNEISVTYEGHVEKISVTGVSNQVKDYEISCNVKEVELYQKSSLDISEVMLEDVVYADERLDGYKEEIVKSGFTFVVNGEETDTVKLEDGENTIRVRYNGLDKKFTVKAYAQSIDRIEVSYCGPAVYEGNEVPKDTSVLLVTVYYKHPYEASVLLSNFEVSYDTYHIVPGENNEIYVRYKGVKSSKPIQVLGLADGLKEIKTVEYRGSNKTGTSLEKDDFYVELEYLSGKVVTSEENPAILDSLTLSSDKLTDGENCIKVVYDGALTGEVNVVANAEGIRVSAAPEASKRPDISTGGSIVSDNTEAPKITIAPNNTVMPMMTVAPGSVSEVPVVTQTPQETDSTSVVPTVSPVAQPQKGSSFTVQGVKYKVNSVTKEGGSVSATRYDKEASKVKLQTAVSLNGYQYTVTKIEKGAFKNCSKLSGTISLTKNVKVIGDSAFYGCKNIKKVVFGSNVTQIGKSSFCNCSKLSTIQFKTGSVKKIGKNAFKGISKKYKVKTTKALKKTYAKRLEGAI